MVAPNKFDQIDDLDRVELLSAYLDGEVTPHQEQQVEQWLEEDPAYEELYQRLMSLREDCHGLPEPENAISHHELCQGVFDAIDQRKRRGWLWWGAAAALGAASVMGMVIPRSLTPQIAQQELNTPTSPTVAVSNQPETASIPTGHSLNISIHQSVIEIPKAPVARPVSRKTLDY